MMTGINYGRRGRKFFTNSGAQSEGKALTKALKLPDGAIIYSLIYSGGNKLCCFLEYLIS
jgi:hypothetical protein